MRNKYIFTIITIVILLLNAEFRVTSAASDFSEEQSIRNYEDRYEISEIDGDYSHKTKVRILPNKYFFVVLGEYVTPFSRWHKTGKIVNIVSDSSHLKLRMPDKKGHDYQMGLCFGGVMVDMKADKEGTYTLRWQAEYTTNEGTIKTAEYKTYVYVYDMLVNPVDGIPFIMEANLKFGNDTWDMGNSNFICTANKKCERLKLSKKEVKGLVPFKVKVYGQDKNGNSKITVIKAGTKGKKVYLNDKIKGRQKYPTTCIRVFYKDKYTGNILTAKFLIKLKDSVEK